MNKINFPYFRIFNRWMPKTCPELPYVDFILYQSLNSQNTNQWLLSLLFAAKRYWKASILFLLRCCQCYCTYQVPSTVFKRVFTHMYRTPCVYTIVAMMWGRGKSPPQKKKENLQHTMLWLLLLPFSTRKDTQHSLSSSTCSKFKFLLVCALRTFYHTVYSIFNIVCTP